MIGKSLLCACPPATSQIIAEAVAVFPILWMAMLSEDDVTACEDMCLITTKREEAIERCAEAIPFIVRLFPEIHSIEPTWERFRNLLKGFRCERLGVNISEEMQTNPDICLLKIYVAVQAVRRRQEDATFTCPPRYLKHPGTGETIRREPRRFETTREVLCYVTSIDLSAEEDEYQLIGTPSAKKRRSRVTR